MYSANQFTHKEAPQTTRGSFHCMHRLENLIHKVIIACFTGGKGYADCCRCLLSFGRCKVVMAIVVYTSI